MARLAERAGAVGLGELEQAQGQRLGVEGIDRVPVTPSSTISGIAQRSLPMQGSR